MTDPDADSLIVVLRPHPYFKAGASMFPHADGWRVKWRTFDTVMQDQDFKDYAAAKKLYHELLTRQTTTHYDNGDFQECDRFWRELYP